MVQYRHEWKHELSFQDYLILRQRLRAVMEPDPHAVDGRYFIRSLYFDNLDDKALREKLDGVNRREKFRMRYYNGDPSLIHLEKKSKLDGLGTKFSADLTAAEAQKIVDGELDWMMDADRPLLRELYVKMSAQGLRPKTIVDYTREPFIYRPGNVRVTLDYDIRSGLGVAAEQPLYVVAKDMEKHTVTVGPESALYGRELSASDFNWLSIPEPDRPLRVTARTRYRQRENPATVWPLEGSRVRLVFDQPQRAVTPGQAVVLYDGDLVLGGGTIEQVHSGQ